MRPFVKSDLIQKFRWGCPILLTALLLTACGGDGATGFAPSVVHTNPADQSTNVPVQTSIQAEFSYPVDPTSINGNTFFIEDVPGTISYQDRTATFTPSRSFERGKRYNATLTTGIKDLDGVPLPSNVRWSFETEGLFSVVNTIPKEGASGVARNTPVMVFFSGPVDPATVEGGQNFTVRAAGGAVVAGQYSYNETTRAAIFTPNSPFAENTSYEARVTTAVTAAAGDPLSEGKTWQFSTSTVVDDSPPQVTQKTPLEGATNIPIDIEITAAFNEAINSATLTGRFILSGPSGPVPAAVTSQNAAMAAVLKPTANLAPNTLYTATLKAGIRNISGVATTADLIWSFTTAAGTDPQAPAFVKSTYPCNEMVNVRVDIPFIWATFQEEMNSSDVRSRFKFQNQEGAAVFGGIRYENDQQRVYYDLFRLAYNTSYTATLEEGIRDGSGKRMPAYTWTFTTQPDPRTVTGPDLIAPTVQCTFPPAGSTHPISVTARAYLSEPVDPDTVRAGTTLIVRELREDRRVLSGTTRVEHDLTLIFQPKDGFKKGRSYEATVTTGVTDRAGNPLSQNYTWTFTATD